MVGLNPNLVVFVSNEKTLDQYEWYIDNIKYMFNKYNITKKCNKKIYIAYMM